MTNQEIEGLLARTVALNAETAALIKQSQQETRDLKKQIGELGIKFGSFTEGMAYPSMAKILARQFKVKVVGANMKARRNGRTMEVDVIGSSPEAVYVVEVKSHLNEEGLQRMLKTLAEFTDFFTDHQGKQVYGILAAVHIDRAMAARVRKHGLYVARISDDTFRLVPSKIYD
jgi:predicted ribonuclease toxin of YeeF-YezG toxin-antitoxin module